MANINATITFALPENMDTDLLELHGAVTKDGTYVLQEQAEYQYGVTSFTPTNIEDNLWYKIRFIDTANGTVGPFSDAVWGGSFTSSSPFLAVSSMYDGANYANTQDVYDYSGLTSEDVSSSRVSAALRRARAVIDYRTSEMDFARFEQFDNDTARRKYNASLRILKEAEINIALGNLYQNMSDDRIIANTREGVSSSSSSVSVGDTTIAGDDIADRNESMMFLAALAGRYYAQGEMLLSSLDTNSVRLAYTSLTTRIPKFRFPFNGW